jgi:uncharacterized membrane protein YbhN (UPF0104 family)
VWLVPALVGLAVWTLIRALRWRALFRSEQRPALGSVTKATILGLFFNNILPARAGEAARIVAIRSYAGVPVAESAATIVVERIFDVLGLLALLFVFVPWFPHVTWLHAATLAAAAAIGLALVLAAVAAHLERRQLRSERFAHLKDSLVHGFAAVRRPRQAAVALGWTLASWLVLGAAFWFVAIGFRLHLSPLAGVLVAIAVGLSFLVPAAPAGLGVFEAAGLAATSAYGVPASRAVAYILVLHALNLVPFLIAGLFLLARGAPGLRSRLALKREAAV